MPTHRSAIEMVVDALLVRGVIDERDARYLYAKITEERTPSVTVQVSSRPSDDVKAGTDG